MPRWDGLAPRWDESMPRWDGLAPRWDESGPFFLVPFFQGSAAFWAGRTRLGGSWPAAASASASCSGRGLDTSLARRAEFRVTFMLGMASV
jgi:hypothetical protein